MFGRRHQHHHAPKMTRLPLIALLLALATWTVGAHAEGKKVASDGSVHRVVVEQLQPVAQPGGWSAGGTALRYTRQAPDGTEHSILLPGTEDAVIDAEPTLDVIASTNEPVVAWIRIDGAGSALVVSRVLSGEWTATRHVFPGANASAPEVQAGRSWVHLTWREKGPMGTRFLRGVLDPVPLAEVHGPEELPLGTGDRDPIPPEGETEPGSSPEPLADYLYASGLVRPPGTVGGGTFYLWGVRDEPIPIKYFEGFVLPEEATDIGRVRTHWLNGRFTIAYESDDRIRYMMRQDGRWTDLRTIDLDEETGPADALLQVMEMIRRDSRDRGDE